MKEYSFKDVEFMTTKDKVLILKTWDRFLRNGLLIKDFTKRLYKHLSLHCGFIARYDINGFYGIYFENPSDTATFFECLFNQRYLPDDYNDLYYAMKDVYNTHKANIDKRIEIETSEKIELIEKAVNRAKRDPEFAREFVSKF